MSTEPAERSVHEKRFIDAISGYINQHFAFLNAHHQQDASLVPHYKSLALPVEHPKTLEEAKEVLDTLVRVIPTDEFLSYQQHMQDLALNTFSDKSAPIYALLGCLEEIKKAYRLLPEKPLMHNLEQCIAQEKQATQAFAFKARIQKEINMWREPEYAKKIDTQSAMLRALLSLQANSPFSQTRVDGRTPSDKLLNLDTYLTTLLTKVYPEYYRYDAQEGLMGEGSHAHDAAHALGGSPLDPCYFDQTILDRLYQSTNNPLWLVLKSMKPITDDFTVADKIQAYQEVSSLLANKKIGARDETNLGLKLAKTTAALLAKAAHEPPQEKVAVASSLDVMLPNLEHWTTQRKEPQALPETFEMFITDNRAPSPTFELYHNPNMQTEANTNLEFLEHVLTPLKAIRKKTLSAADKSTVLAILQRAERIIQINPALGPELYAALKSNKVLYQTFQSQLAWLEPIKDANTIERSSFYERWPKPYTVEDVKLDNLLLNTLDEERLNEERLITDASRMKLRLEPMLQSNTLTHEKRQAMIDYLERCDELVNAYLAVATYRPKKTSQLQESFVRRHGSPNYRTFIHLKNELLQDTSLGPEFCLKTYEPDEYETLCNVHNILNEADIPQDPRFDGLLADAKARKIKNTYQPIYDILVAKQQTLSPSVPSFTTDEEDTIVNALQHVKQLITSEPDLNIPLNLALSLMQDDPDNTLKQYHSTRINQALQELEHQANQVPFGDYQAAINNQAFFISLSNHALSKEDVIATYQKLIQRIEKQNFSPVQKRALIRGIIADAGSQFAEEAGITYAASPDALTYPLNFANEKTTEDELLPILHKLATLQNKSLTPYEQHQFLALLADARPIITQNPSLAGVLSTVITQRMDHETSYFIQDEAFQHALQTHLDWLAPINTLPMDITHSEQHATLPHASLDSEQAFLDTIEAEYKREERFVRAVSRARLTLGPMLHDESLPRKKQAMIRTYLENTDELIRAYTHMQPTRRRKQTSRQVAENYLGMRKSETFRQYTNYKNQLSSISNPSLDLPQAEIDLDESLIHINNAYIAWHAGLHEAGDFKNLTQDFITNVVEPLAGFNSTMLSPAEGIRYLDLLDYAWVFVENNPSFAIMLSRQIVQRLEIEQRFLKKANAGFVERLQSYLDELQTLVQQPDSNPIILANNTSVVWQRNKPPYAPLTRDFQSCIAANHAEACINTGKFAALTIIDDSSPKQREAALLRSALSFNPEHPDGVLIMHGYLEAIAEEAINQKQTIIHPDNQALLDYLMQRMHPISSTLSLQDKLSAYERLIHAISTPQLGTEKKTALIRQLSHEAMHLARNEPKTNESMMRTFLKIFNDIAPLNIKNVNKPLEAFIVERTIQPPSTLTSEEPLEHELIQDITNAFLDDERFMATLYLETLRLQDSPDDPHHAALATLANAYNMIPKLQGDITDAQALTRAYLIKYQSPELRHYVELKKKFLKDNKRYFNNIFHGFNTNLLRTFTSIEKKYKHWADHTALPEDRRLTEACHNLTQNEYHLQRALTGQAKARRIIDNSYISVSARDKALLRRALDFDLHKENDQSEFTGYWNIVIHTLDTNNPDTLRLIELIQTSSKPTDRHHATPLEKLNSYYELLEAISHGLLGSEAESLIKPLIQKALAVAVTIQEPPGTNTKEIEAILMNMELCLVHEMPMYQAMIQAFITKHAPEPDIVIIEDVRQRFIQDVVTPIQANPNDDTVVSQALKKATLISRYNPLLALPLNIAFNQMFDKNVAHLLHWPGTTQLDMYKKIIEQNLCFINLGRPPLSLKQQLETYQTLIHAIEREPFNTKTKRELLQRILAQVEKRVQAHMQEESLNQDEEAQLKSIENAIPPIAREAYLMLADEVETHARFLSEIINPLSAFHNKTLSKPEQAEFLGLLMQARESIHQNPTLGLILRELIQQRMQREKSYILPNKGFQRQLQKHLNWLKIIKEPKHSSCYDHLPQTDEPEEKAFVAQIEDELLRQERFISNVLRIKLRLAPFADDKTLSLNKRAFIHTFLDRSEALIQAYQTINLPTAETIEELGRAFQTMHESEEFTAYERLRDEIIDDDQTYYTKLGLDAYTADVSTNFSALQASYETLMPGDVAGDFERFTQNRTLAKAFQAGEREAQQLSQEHPSPKNKKKALLRQALTYTHHDPEDRAKTEGYLSVMLTELAADNTPENQELRALISAKGTSEESIQAILNLPSSELTALYRHSHNPVWLVLKNVRATSLHNKLQSYQELIQAIANEELGSGERSELIIKLTHDAMKLAQDAGENTRVVESMFEDMIHTIETLGFGNLKHLPKTLEQFLRDNQIQAPTREQNNHVMDDFIQTTVNPIAMLLRAKEPDEALSHEEKEIIRHALWKATQLVKHNPKLALPIHIALHGSPNNIGQALATRLKKYPSKSIKNFLSKLQDATQNIPAETYDMLLNNPSSPLIQSEDDNNPLNLALHALEATQASQFSLTDQLISNQYLMESLVSADLDADQKHRWLEQLIHQSMQLAATYEPLHNSKSVEKILERMSRLLHEQPELKALLQTFIKDRAMTRPTVQANLETTDRFIHEVIQPIAAIRAKPLSHLAKKDELLICDSLKTAQELCLRNPMLAFMVKASFDKMGSPFMKNLMAYNSTRINAALEYFEKNLAHINEQEPAVIVHSDRWLAKKNQAEIEARKALSPDEDAEQIKIMKSMSKFTRALEEFLSGEEIFAFKQAHTKAILAPLLYDKHLTRADKDAIKTYIDTSDTLIHLYLDLGFNDVLSDTSQPTEVIAGRIAEIQQSEDFKMYFFHLVQLVGQYHKLMKIESQHKASFNSQAGTFLAQSFQRLMRYNLPMLEMIKDCPPELIDNIKASIQVNLDNAMYANGYSGEFQDRAASNAIAPLQRLITLNLNAPTLENSNYANLKDRESERARRIDGYLKAMLTEAYPGLFSLDIHGYLRTSEAIHQALGTLHSMRGMIDPRNFDAAALDALYAADKNPLWIVLKSTKPILEHQFSLEDKIHAYEQLLKLAKTKQLGRPVLPSIHKKLAADITALQGVQQDITARYRDELREIQDTGHDMRHNMDQEDRKDTTQGDTKPPSSPKKT